MRLAIEVPTRICAQCTSHWRIAAYLPAGPTPPSRYHVAPECAEAEVRQGRPRTDKWAWRIKNCPVASQIDPHTLAQAISAHATPPVKSDVPVVLFFGHSFCRQLFESLICRFDSYIHGGYINAVRDKFAGPNNLWEVREGGGTCHGYCQVREGSIIATNPQHASRRNAATPHHHTKTANRSSSKACIRARPTPTSLTTLLSRPIAVTMGRCVSHLGPTDVMAQQACVCATYMRSVGRARLVPTKRFLVQ